MHGYLVKFETVTIGGSDLRIRSLLDNQQYADPEGDAERAGITAATWPLFGLLWPSSQVLATLMDTFDLTGKRILEIGAGLGLASLVVQRRHGDMTATDFHPLCHAFMDENTRLNDLLPMKYQSGNWATDNPALGKFDLIIGSDVLYERDHAQQLSAFIDRHSAQTVEVIIIDPDRSNRAHFCREMRNRNYSQTEHRADCLLGNGKPYKGRFLGFRRGFTITA